MHNRHKREIVIFNPQRSMDKVFRAMKTKFTTPNESYTRLSSRHTTGRVNYDRDVIIHPILHK